MADAFNDDDEDSQGNDELQKQIRLARMRGENMDYEMQDNNVDEYAGVNDYSEAQGKIATWIQKDDVRRFIKREFQTFLRSHKDENTE